MLILWYKLAFGNDSPENAIYLSKISIYLSERENRARYILGKVHWDSLYIGADKKKLVIVSLFSQGGS